MHRFKTKENEPLTVTTAAGQQPPLCLEKTLENPACIASVDYYRLVTVLYRYPGDEQVCTLLYAMRRQARQFLASLGLTDKVAKSYDIFKWKWQGDFLGAGTIYVNERFFTLKKSAEESGITSQLPFGAVIPAIADRTGASPLISAEELAATLAEVHLEETVQQ